MAGPCSRPGRRALSAIITHGEDGSLVPAEDPAALAQGLERLLKDLGARHDLGEAGKKRLALDFSRERIVQRISGALRDPGRRLAS